MNTIKHDRPRYELTLEAAPDPGGPSAALRLRRLLKYAGRVCRLRCVEAREVTPEPDRPPAAVPGGPRAEK